MSNMDEIELICAANAECDRLQAKIMKLEQKIEEQTRQIEEQAFQLGNQGYKIKNQRHEINNRLKENSKLKDLLKECINSSHKGFFAIQEDNESDDWSIFQYREVQDFYVVKDKIQSIIGESEETNETR